MKQRNKFIFTLIFSYILALQIEFIINIFRIPADPGFISGDFAIGFVYIKSVSSKSIFTNMKSFVCTIKFEKTGLLLTNIFSFIFNIGTKYLTGVNMI